MPAICECDQFLVRGRNLYLASNFKGELMKNKFAMVTRSDDNITDLTDVTHPILRDYAEQWGCDFITLDTKEDWMTDYELAHYRILRVRELLETYERILVIDSDVVIMPTCPNPFEVVPVDKIGSIYEDKGSREAMRQGVIMSIQERFGDVGWEDGYINTGFFVVSRQHSNIFQRIGDASTITPSMPLNGLWKGFGYDDALIGYNIHTFGHEVHELSFQFNHMSMFSEDWNGNANRFNSHVIHYAGLARFPDDRSGRVLTNGNDMACRLELIESDIIRITNGLMEFKQVTSLNTQGFGSECYNAKMGVAEKPVILKVPHTEECYFREVKVLASNIKGLVKCLDVGVNDMGKFMVLEKLHDIPEYLEPEVMLALATDVLITSRQLYKHGIPWICRKEHIKMDDEGHIKLLDFGDDPYDRPIPFYGKEEAIIKDGECDISGGYIDRGLFPWSGYLALMKWYCDNNDIPYNIIEAAEASMVAYEYQNLKDVHHPIWHEEYSDILRTESEKDDPKYGQLVPANRDCNDRADMIYENIEPWMTEETTWLDIGCNVGWFCFEFADHFDMHGIDFDNEKVQFATMLAEGQGSSATFSTWDINLSTVDSLPEYDVISVLSMMHLQLVKDQDPIAFWKLFKAITKKAKKMFIFEFPRHSMGLLNIHPKFFVQNVKLHGAFTSVEEIGISDAGRAVLKCLR
jgi:hypothetical protein